MNTQSSDNDNTGGRDIWSVSRLNREARSLIETGLPLLWIEGEISNLATPASGHIYFSLKDAGAQIRCAMFRGRNQHLDFDPENGMQVLMRAKAGLYEGRGEFQLIVEQMEQAGAGALWRAFEELKKRLDKEGLFAEEHKQALPDHVRTIGVVTSPSGAVIRDILTVLDRRFSAIAVIIYPTLVQGAGAAEQIARAIAKADQRQECDVLIIARGGGSLEDLWSFNEEVVARAIFACKLPVVSGVGHETDITIADFVADKRAATPSAAAELLSPNQGEWLASMVAFRARLLSIMRNKFAHLHQTLLLTGKRLQHPGRHLQDIAQRLDELGLRIDGAHRNFLQTQTAKAALLRARLEAVNPAHAVQHMSGRCEELSLRLAAAMRLRHANAHAGLTSVSRALDAISPLATLDRGYAIVMREQRHIVHRASELSPGDKVNARLARGSIDCTVDEIHD